MSSRTVPLDRGVCVQIGQLSRPQVGRGQDGSLTLLLTCVTQRFTVQASDRRLTRLDGTLAEERANKATILAYYGSFAYTGLAASSRTEGTDEMLMRALAKEHKNADEAMRNLASEASRTIGRLRLQGLRPQKERVARRTSFVGCGFVGLRDPASAGRSQVTDNLHPFLTVVSNAQSLSRGWRPEASPQFGVHGAFLSEEQPFLLHEAGQPVPTALRTQTMRMIAACLRRGVHAEAVARLLARAIREVARTNRAVGPNVMCTFVHREQVKASTKQVISGGPIPIVPEVMAEFSYFKRLRDASPPRFIYSPGDPGELVHYGPNYAESGLQMKGLIFGPSNLVPVPTDPNPGLNRTV
jgi:hypothetical protein